MNEIGTSPQRTFSPFKMNEDGWGIMACDEILPPVALDLGFSSEAGALAVAHALEHAYLQGKTHGLKWAVTTMSGLYSSEVA